MGHSYRFDKLVAASSKKRWRCRTRDCNWCIYSKNDVENSDVQTRTPHREHCILDPDARCVEIVISDLKVDARTQLTPIPTLYNGATAMLSVNPTIASRFPLFGQIDSSLYRQRLSNLPTLPASRETLNLPANLQQTISGANFLLYSSQGNEILIFATQENI